LLNERQTESRLGHLCERHRLCASNGLGRASNVFQIREFE
jgi:hypothetical protein